MYLKLLQTNLTIILLSVIAMSPFSLLANTNIEDIKIGFSPGDSARQTVLLAISEAKNSIDIAAYSFTSKPIALALLDAKNRGVHVRLVADKKSNSNRYTAATYLSNHQIPVKLNDKYAIMHNKFIIIDGHSVETGSFNYTRSAATRNAENVIYFRHQSEIASKYMKEFERLWKEAISISPTY
ncbi:PLD-like domain-containing protein (plasmid) [Candidatus Erwinia haradaeae]|uniref:phospholipase D n=1 Tax=Candidatus Erwinia haradaeae TaxID=1922217 RepID=A0A451DDP2_9GAMM|nr:phospholipase D family protein [Candidatus Erwinia haradaeae]VFP84641.1 PLD-like domain-containing protein [Candidatus Erwinia haradaeae]